MAHGTPLDDNYSRWTPRAAETTDTEYILQHGLWSTTVPIHAFQAAAALPC